MTEINMRNAIKKIHQVGHDWRSVTPFEDTHAGYPLPSVIISIMLAIKMANMAKGLKYFQHINQYKPGRVPVINSISSANLEFQFKYKLNLMMYSGNYLTTLENFPPSNELNYVLTFESIENDLSITFVKNYNAFEKLHFLSLDRRTIWTNLKRQNLIWHASM